MSLLIVGGAVSLLVQWLKQKSGSTLETMLILLGTSLGAAAIYTVLAKTGFLPTVYGVLVTASAIYSLVIARFESAPSQD
jgi:hypothetical protein